MEDRLTVGLAVTGSCCTFSRIPDIVRSLQEKNCRVIPIVSEHADTIASRFGGAGECVKILEELCGERAICSIVTAEPIGPTGYLDVLVIAPCTGNTLAKLSMGITDGTVLMAAKAHLRNEKPLVIAISTNDALGMNFKNLGALMNTKHVYFVPFGQDDHIKKPNSLIAETELIPDTIAAALKGKQLQPVLITPKSCSR